MFDIKLNSVVKENIYKTQWVKEVLYEVETAAATKKQETELEVTELQMRPWSFKSKNG